MRIVLAAMAATSLFVCSSAVYAFGTVNILGQNAEHERITRHALGCGEQGAPSSGACFQAGALAEIAGRSGTFGAVGAPDNPINGLTSDAKSHCDDGDYMDVAGYPHSRADAQAALENCRNHMKSEMDVAVNDAAKLVQSGKLVDAEIPTVFNCTFTLTKGRAFCNVIEDFGLALHAAQDFYSHSNWADQSDPAKPVSISNPLGLNKTGRAPWLDLRQSAPATPAVGVSSVSGRSLKMVDVGTGAFVQVNGPQWVEVDKRTWRVVFNFSEVQRRDTEVRLFDSSRNVRLALNLSDSTVFYGVGGPEAATQPLYRIASTSDQSRIPGSDIAWDSQGSGFPNGLMTGCFLGSLPDGTSGCPGRVTHYDLNKDKGTIDPQIGVGTTSRGIVDSNFRRAVEAAIDDTRDKWAQLRAALLARYGAHDGGLMVCALVSEANYDRDCH